MGHQVGQLLGGEAVAVVAVLTRVEVAARRSRPDVTAGVCATQRRIAANDRLALVGLCGERYSDTPYVAGHRASSGRRDSGINFCQGQGTTFLEVAHTRQGRFAQALAHIEKVGALSAAIGHAMEEQIHHWLRIILYLAVLAWAEAGRWADSLYAQRESMSMVPATIHYNLVHVTLAFVEHAGDLRDAFLGQPAVAQLLGKT